MDKGQKLSEFTYGAPKNDKPRFTMVQDSNGRQHFIEKNLIDELIAKIAMEKDVGGYLNDVGEPGEKLEVTPERTDDEVIDGDEDAEDDEEIMDLDDWINSMDEDVDKYETMEKSPSVILFVMALINY